LVVLEGAQASFVVDQLLPQRLVLAVILNLVVAL